MPTMKNNNTKINKLLIVAAAIGLLIIPSSLFAQDFPCGGTDPYATCPLDTWVVVLAGAALLFAVLHLYKKQKAQTQR